MPEEEIVDFDSIQKGDIGVYERFFKENYVEIVRYAHRFVRNQEIAEEIAQEVFMYLWEKRASISIQSSLKSYLFSAAKNKSINYIKLELPKSQALHDIETIELGASSEFKEQDSSKLIERKVKEAIDQLPKKCREVFILSRNAGLTYDEIAEEMDISKKTVENQMGIALKKLRESLKPLMDAVRRDN